MMNINKILSIITAAAIVTCFTGCSNNVSTTSQPLNVTASADNALTPVDTNTTEVPPSDTSNIVSDPLSDTSVLTSGNEWEPVLSNAETLKVVADNLENANSFIMTCKIKGSVPDSQAKPLLIVNEYTYIVTKDTTCLKSTYQDLNSDAQPAVYEEYRTVEDSILTTITKYDEEWVCNTSKKMQRNDMISDTIDSIALLRFFNTKYTYKNTDTVNTVPVVRNEDGSISMTFPAWNKWESSDKELCAHPFAGLIRFPEMTGELHNMTLSDANGNVTYTLDNSYNLKTIEADICAKDIYDLHIEIEFSEYNNVLPLIVPMYTNVDSN